MENIFVYAAVISDFFLYAYDSTKMYYFEFLTALEKTIKKIMMFRRKLRITQLALFAKQKYTFVIN